MLNSEQNPELSVATNDDSSNEAELIKNILIRFLLRQNDKTLSLFEI